MAHHILDMPADSDRVRELRIGDTVTLRRTLYGIRDATLIHMFDRGRRTRLDLRGHAVIHTAPNVHRVAPSPEAPVGYAPFCIGTTTSMRMERFTADLMRREGVRIIIGKGGMGPQTQAAFAEQGGAYLAIVGGAAALETTWIERIEDVDLDDLHPESLWRFAIRDFGPLLVGMDAQGGSLFAEVQRDVASRRDAVIASLEEAR
ncbi:fumarate hydratase C-terminal domain-containing protein [Methylobacterium isbiliense]|jgi:L(+)-tartrate dehydratase beta subunit|uniref:L(+)-tartrate dehydratase subunit beta n=1 Tax=Methylobacterium isbiliense TaxID=315478 RepID=A0ABQ4S9S7_9HYPH|nr:fumarate hydratase C-terminal domain-containing protein [Methylobacterium isbiliense]MDN3622481.1 fumarate hydratase C-terminal domain-containing protein [Methylobacterium isbiliense]GJD99283.1 L(+)-tartrate dehydratase subunit beta [Methylobacterium isbiliense]